MLMRIIPLCWQRRGFSEGGVGVDPSTQRVCSSIRPHRETSSSPHTSRRSRHSRNSCVDVSSIYAALRSARLLTQTLSLSLDISYLPSMVDADSSAL